MYTILVGEHEGRQQLGTWENGIQIDLKEIESEAVDWIYTTLRYCPMVGFCEHGNEQAVSVKDGEYHDYLSSYWLLREDFVPRK